jgi:predicted transposase YdaD
VVVICPHRDLTFGNPEPVREFLEHRVQWIELQPLDGQPPATPLARALSLLLQPESQVRRVSDALREQARSDTRAAEVLPLIPAIVLARFSDRPLSEICEMVGITLDDFTKSRAYQEIFGLGEARGETKVTLLQLNRRCGSLSTATTARIQALPLEQLEALAEALLDFTGPADLDAWLAAHT